MPESPSSRAWIAHVIPFVAWIFLMQVLGDPAGWKYAVRSILCLGIFLYLKPWSYGYPKLNPRNLFSATGAGLLVLVIWILPETDWASRFEEFHKAYLTIGLLSPWPWDLAPPLQMVRYAPETDGWLFALTRLAGSAFVIAFIEEFFWRSWLTRWIDKENFLEQDPGTVSTKAVVIASLMFATVHQRWIAGLLCGLIWGFYYRKTRDIWAVGYAHMLTNLLLGVYVLWSGKFEFWA